MIPSYDDLTPGIPDVIDSEAVDQLALFLREDLHKRSGDQEDRKRRAPDLPPAGVFACLRATNREPSASAKASASATAAADKTAKQARYDPRTANGALLAIAHDFSPRVMRIDAGEVVLDVSGLGRLIGEPPAIERELRRAVAAAGVEASVAIAPTQTAARLLAAQPGASAIARLPVARLQPLETLPPAMNQRDRERPYETLRRWGIATLGELAALPAAELSSRLGRRGVALQRLARGLDARPFVPDAGTPRFMDRLELEWPIEDLEPLSFVLARLLEPLSAALERADRGAAAVRLELRLTDRSTHARVLQLPAPMRDARVLRTLLLLDLESHPPFGGSSEGRPPSPTATADRLPAEAREAGGGGSAQRGGGGAPPTLREPQGRPEHRRRASEVMIDVVAIELDPAPARITQFSLLQRALPSPETLSTLTARLSALVGESRIGSPALIDSHAPDAFEMARFAPDTEGADAVGANGAEGAEGAKGAGAEGADGADGADGAEGADGAGADGADGAGAEGAMTLRRQRVPCALRVRVERGRPVHIASSRRGMPYGAIVQAAGPWRTSGQWWADARRAGGRGPGDRAEGGWNRDEWDVALANGIVCRIFQHRTTRCWFFEGLYD